MCVEHMHIYIYTYIYKWEPINVHSIELTNIHTHHGWLSNIEWLNNKTNEQLMFIYYTFLCVFVVQTISMSSSYCSPSSLSQNIFEIENSDEIRAAVCKPHKPNEKKKCLHTFTHPSTLFICIQFVRICKAYGIFMNVIYIHRNWDFSNGEHLHWIPTKHNF